MSSSPSARWIAIAASALACFGAASADVPTVTPSEGGLGATVALTGLGFAPVHTPKVRLMPHAGSLNAARTPGEYPRVSRLARYQASQGADMVSLAYMRVQMEEPAARLLITLLDGTRDRQAILAELKARAGVELTETDLERNLVELARLFLLEP